VVWVIQGLDFLDSIQFTCQLFWFVNQDGQVLRAYPKIFSLELEGK